MSRASHSPCPLCGNVKAHIVYPSLHPIDSRESPKGPGGYAPSASWREEGTIVRCLACNVVYKDPFPKPEILKKGYEESIDEQYLALLPERRATFAHELHFIERYIKPRRDAPQKPRMLDTSRILQNSRSSNVIKNRNPRILDIGCAEGTLLALAREHGWDVTGVEPNKHFIRWAHKHYKLPLLQGSVFHPALKRGSYDVITLLDVIEHVHNPRAFLQRCYELLAPEGILFISTPDIGSLPARMMRRRWFYILTIHVFYFTRRTMSGLLRSAGFTDIRTRRYMLRTRLSYVADKSRGYLGPLGTLLAKGVSLLRLGDREMTYWLGQRLFIARKPKHSV